MSDNNDGWVRVARKSADETWDFKTTKEIAGKYVDSKDVVVKKGMSAGQTKTIYTLEKADGKLVAIWGTAFLDSRFTDIAIGDEVKIVYLGKENNEKTGRSLHTFDVLTRKAQTPAQPKEETAAEETEEVNPDDVPF